MSNMNEVSSGDKHVVCQYADYIATFGLWINKNPLNYTVPLLLLQLSIITITSLIIEIILSPLGQSSIVAQILGGVVYGPSLLGHQNIMGPKLFPNRSIINVETLATFGITFFLFAIGVRTDVRILIRPGRKALCLGLAAVFITMIFTLPLSFIMKAYVTMDDSLARALPYLAASQSLSAFSNVSCLLNELKMASGDIGRIASSTSMLTDAMGITMVTVIFSLIQSDFGMYRCAVSLGSAAVFTLVLAFGVRPFFRRMVRRMPTGKPLREHHVFFCFAGTLLSGLLSEVIGQHFTFGPMLFGMMVPDGPALASPIIAKLDLPIGKFLYPTFLTTSGLKTNIFMISFRSFCIMLVLVAFGCTVKICGVIFVSRFLNIYTIDSVVIGLILNTKGVCELLMYNLWRDGGV